jgi:hypothetical protein
MRMTGSMTRTRDSEPQALNHYMPDEFGGESESEGEQGVPAWFSEHQTATDNRFRAMHDAVKAIHDTLMGALGRRHARGDDEVEDPNMASGEPEPYERGDTDDKARRKRRTADQPIQTLAELNARWRQLRPRQRTRDSTPWKIRSLAELNRLHKNHYHVR